MGIFDFLKGKQLPSGDPATQKAGQKAINQNADLAVRQQAVINLAEIGTQEAIYCMLMRFTKVIGTNIPDDDEKQLVYNKVQSLGEKSIQPLIKFIKTNNQIAQALQLMRDLCSDELFVNHILQLIDTFDPYDSKYPDKKIQIFTTLSNFKDHRIIEALTPFLDDDDDDVAIAAIEAISGQEDEDNSRELLINLIIDSDEQPRIRIKACEAIAQSQWKVKGFRKQIASVLPDRFYMDQKGHINLKGGLSI